MYSIKARRAKHFYSARNGSSAYFHRAIRKYGEDAFKFSVIKICRSYEEACSQEIKLIAALKPQYNLSAGGMGSVGYKMPQAAIEKVRAANLGRPGFWTGKKLPAHVVEAMSIRNNTDERRQAWTDFRKLGPQKIRKKVICLNTGQEFESALAAGKFYSVHASSISAVCAKKRKRTANLIFRYATDSSVTPDELLRVNESVYNNRPDLRPKGNC